MRVSYAETAAKEIETTLDFLEGRSSSAASSLRERLQDVERRLGSYPFIGQPVTARGKSMRRIVVQPYLLFYRVIGNDVIIVGLRHAARQPSSMPT